MLCRVAFSAEAVERESVVVLRSGGVLHGVVTQVDERYIVNRQHSSVDVPAAQVLLVAGSMEEAYQKQRGQLDSKLTGATTDRHLALADWCLRYGMLYGAEQEIAAARAIDARDSRVGLMERRLAVAQKPKKQPATGVTAAVDEDGETPAEQELRELEAKVEELPSGVVERFTRKLQPLLVNSCTASGCHRPGGTQDFQLDRAVLHGLSNRRITLRNLVATLELVNRNSPQQSDLVTVPRRTHGGMKRPVIGPRQENQLVLLVDWVGMVTQSNAFVVEPLQMAATSDALPMPMPEGVDFAGVAKPRNPRMVDRSVQQASATDPLEAMLPKGEVKFGADLRPWQPKDEFDPEIFNRAEAKRREKAGEPTAAGPTSAK
jgi:hypothetical protein